MKVLAFQDRGQKCSFWPDSSLTTFDKKYSSRRSYTRYSRPCISSPRLGRRRAPTNPGGPPGFHQLLRAARPSTRWHQTTLLDTRDRRAHGSSVRNEGQTGREEVRTYSADAPADPCAATSISRQPAPPTWCKRARIQRDRADGGTNLLRLRLLRGEVTSLLRTKHQRRSWQRCCSAVRALGLRLWRRRFDTRSRNSHADGGAGSTAAGAGGWPARAALMPQVRRAMEPRHGRRLRHCRYPTGQAALLDLLVTMALLAPAVGVDLPAQRFFRQRRPSQDLLSPTAVSSRSDV